VLVSLSKDGALQARIMARARMKVVRGSTSRGAVRALVGIVRALRNAPLDAAFAVDGPRGPIGEVQPGAAMCAKSVDGVLVPIGSACAPAKILTRAWDRMALPWPFARAVVIVGAPLPEGATACAIAEAIEAVNARAKAELEGASASEQDRARMA
jgi:lysophospholipid acyltransferase (LPLAT)-like uncharacterized protein